MFRQFLTIQDQDNEELQSAIQRLGIRSIAPPMRVFRISPHRTSPVKGIGWFATQKIMRGTPLLAEKALFEAVGNYTDDGITAKRDRLLPPDLADFNALTTQQGQIKSGLFLEAARLNHSCIPNAYWAWNRMLNRLTIHAMVEIAKDDEITISYRPATGYHTRRQREIELRKWGFCCDCGACQPQSLFGAGSDSRRLQMRRLQDKIDTRNYPPGNIIQRLYDIGKLEHLLRQEELIYPMLADIYHLAAEWYQDTLLGDTSRAASYEDGNRKQALELARKELDLDVACTGHRSPEVAKTLRFIRQLKD